MSDNLLDQLLERTVGEMQRIVDELPCSDKPFNQRKLTSEEQMARYVEMRDDPQAWIKMQKQRGQKAVIDYARQMERKIDKEIARV